MRRLGNITLEMIRSGLPAVNDWLHTVQERFGVNKKAGIPTLKEIPENQWGVFRDTTAGTLSLWANDEGTLVSTSLSVTGGGNVLGPSSAGDNNVVLFDGTTGKILKDSGVTLSSKEDTGVAAGLVAGHEAAPDPHPQYAVSGDLSAHVTDFSNPHNVTKAQVGLANVDNVSAADLRDRSTHTGTQLAATISDFNTAADARATLAVAAHEAAGDPHPQYALDADLAGYVPTTRTVNGKALNADISLTASDVGAPSGSGTSTGTNTGDETAARIGTIINGATAKATPADADNLAVTDSTASHVVRKTTWAQIKAALKTYFDTLYQPVAASLTSWAGVTRAAGFDTFAATPSSANLAALLTDESNSGVVPFMSTGTWTPVLTFATAGNLSVAYSAQAGVWTRIGRLLFVSFQIQTSTFTHSTASGDLQITGLPVANNNAYLYTGSLTFQGATLGAGYSQVQMQLATSASLITLRASGSGSTAVNLGTGNFPTGGTVILRGTLIYHV